MTPTELMAMIVALMVQAAASSPKAQSRPFSLVRAALTKVARRLLASTVKRRETIGPHHG